MKNTVRTVLASGLFVVMLMSAAAPALAQATATDFYTQYRKAFEAAKKIDELLPYMSAARRKQVEETPAAERAEMFELVKMMGQMTDVKVVKETPTANGATLTVTGVDSDKTVMNGTITIIKEGGAFKLDKESWSNK